MLILLLPLLSIISLWTSPTDPLISMWGCWLSSLRSDHLQLTETMEHSLVVQSAWVDLLLKLITFPRIILAPFRVSIEKTPSPLKWAWEIQPPLQLDWQHVNLPLLSVCCTLTWNKKSKSRGDIMGHHFQQEQQQPQAPGRGASSVEASAHTEDCVWSKMTSTGPTTGQQSRPHSAHTWGGLGLLLAAPWFSSPLPGHVFNLIL